MRHPLAALLPLLVPALALVQPAGAQVAELAPNFVEVGDEARIRAGFVPAFQFGSGITNISPMGGGVAVADFDNDGDQDVYVVCGGILRDALFRNDGTGRFTNVAGSAGLDRHLGMSAAAGDFDGDGWIDLFVCSLGQTSGGAGVGRHRLMRNNGNMTFTDVAAQAGVNYASAMVPDGIGAAFGDYDLDGDLDLFVTGWVPISSGNRLYRNEGDGTFTDVTTAAGIDQIRGFAPRFVDMDGDRWPELLIAADFYTSRYFVNNTDGTFTDFTQGSGTGIDANGMGQTVGDFDGNGLLDWYVTSIYSLNPGNVLIPGTGNMLYLNQGGHQYVESSIPAGVNDGAWGWGTVAVDFDHDGHLDIAETNGFKAYNGAGVQEWIREPAYLWLNNGDGTFREKGQGHGLRHFREGRGLAAFDADGDGDMELLLMTNQGKLYYFRNDMDVPGRHWLRVFLDTRGTYLAPNGMGSRVYVTVSGQSQLRSIDGGNNYVSQSELSAHFGLGPATVVDELRVEWSNGRVTYMDDVRADQTLTVVFCPANWNGRDGATPADLAAFQADWAAGNADFNRDGVTDQADADEFAAAYALGCP